MLPSTREAPPRRPHQIGRPRLKGERLPNLSVVAQDPRTVWKPTKIANWYGSEERMVEVSSQTAVWYSTGLFAVPIRWVLVRDPEGKFKTQALLCTDLEADPKKIVCWFVMRWQLEVTLVRKELWAQEEQTLYGSPAQTDTIKVPRAYVERLTDAVCYAA
jgi:hypothetical protein